MLGGTALGMDTIEEESSSAVQDSPLRQSPAQPQQQRQRTGSGRSLQGLVQQQLHPETPTSAQPHSPMRSGGSELQSGVGSLAQGLGSIVREALADPEGEEAVSQVCV